MRPSARRYPNKNIIFIVILCSFFLLLSECSLIRNIRQRDISKAPPTSFLPSLDKSLESLSFDARISIQTNLGDVTITAEVYYAGMDSITIQIKDPLKRKLATLWLTNDNYRLWLQRENRELSGTEFPDNIVDFQIPVISISSISRLFIGQINLKNKDFSIKTDNLGRPRQIIPKSDPNLIIGYNNWETIDSYYQIPADITITGNLNSTIHIHFSQFQLKLRKLS